MTKRIFRSICLVALTVFVAALFLIMGVLYGYFSQEQLEQLTLQTELTARGVEAGGTEYLAGLGWEKYRVTLIGPGGAVLYDSQADTTGMENHLEREEVREALALGAGQASRYSTTLMERQYYSAQRLEDGSVVRLSARYRGPLSLVLDMSWSIAAVVIVAVSLSLMLAAHLSKQIVRPLNSLNLDRPLSNGGYDEIAPLLRRIDAQQKKLKEQAEQLRRRREQFDSITDSMAEGLILLDAEGRILSINRSAMTLFGARKGCIGEHFTAVCRMNEVEQLVAKAARGQRGEAVVPLAGGSYQLDVSPVVTDGEATGAALLVFDVTERVQAEQLRREFTANVSHELKTPLQSISGYAELMAGGLVRPEDTQGFAAKIHTEARRMILLVEDIIRLSRLDEGPENEHFEDVDLTALARDVVAELTPQAEMAEVKCVIWGNPVTVRAVPQVLAGMIRNLCDNAIKYNRPGGEVRITVAAEPGGARLTVRDTGIGIAPEHQSRIFERFYRVDKSRSKAVGGTGLGLSIVKHGAKLHGAKLELSSTPGKGTSISLFFAKQAAEDK